MANIIDPSNNEQEIVPSSSEPEMVSKDLLTNRIAELNRKHNSAMESLKNEMNEKIASISNNAVANQAANNVINADTQTQQNQNQQFPANPVITQDDLAKILEMHDQRVEQTRQQQQADKKRADDLAALNARKQEVAKKISDAINDDDEFKQLSEDPNLQIDHQTLFGMLSDDDDAPQIVKKLLQDKEALNSFNSSNIADKTKILNNLGKQVAIENASGKFIQSSPSLSGRGNAAPGKSLDSMTPDEMKAFYRKNGLY